MVYLYFSPFLLVPNDISNRLAGSETSYIRNSFFIRQRALIMTTFVSSNPNETAKRCRRPFNKPRNYVSKEYVYKYVQSKMVKTKTYVQSVMVFVQTKLMLSTVCVCKNRHRNRSKVIGRM